MAAAFALVAVASVAAVGLAARVAVRSEFGGYLYEVWAYRQRDPVQPAPPGGLRLRDPSELRLRNGGGLRLRDPGALPAPPPDGQPFGVRRLPGPRWRAMLRLMGGLAERRFLQRVDRLLWRVGAVVALGGAAAGAVVARRWSSRLDRLTRRALERARREQGPSPAQGDEIDQLDAAFAAMEQALAKEDQRRRRLLADIAHDLKTPLTVVQANLEAMLDGVLPASPERLAALHTQVGLLARLVTDLRELAMAEAGELTLRRSVQDVGQLVRRVVELWGPQAQERGVQVELEVQGQPEASVDPDRFAQILLNLLSNALRYVPAQGGRIRIGVRAQAAGPPGGSSPAPPAGPRAGPPAGSRAEPPAGSLAGGTRAGAADKAGGVVSVDGVVVTVEDNGPGIAPEDLPYIFDHFYRGDPARSRATGGFGVGLGIVRSLVEAHGGWVRAENRPEGGARFQLWLPAAPPEPADGAGE